VDSIFSEVEHIGRKAHQKPDEAREQFGEDERESTDPLSICARPPNYPVLKSTILDFLQRVSKFHGFVTFHGIDDRSIMWCTPACIFVLPINPAAGVL
jgi:hypothetical protein